MHLIAGGKRPFDHPELIVRLGLEFEHHATVAEGLGLQHQVVFAAALDIDDRITRPQSLDGHWLRGTLVCVHSTTVGHPR